jgi:hypothetical protein
MSRDEREIVIDGIFAENALRGGTLSQFQLDNDPALAGLISVALADAYRAGTLDSREASRFFDMGRTEGFRAGLHAARRPLSLQKQG